MAEQDVLTRTERANREIGYLATGGFHETAVPAVEIDTGRMTAQIRQSLERVACIVVMVGDSTEKADVLRHYLAGYERALYESPQVRHRDRIIGRNLDVDAMGVAPGVIFNNPTLDVIGSGSADPTQSKYMQQIPTRSEWIAGARHVLETTPDASPGQPMAADFPSSEVPVHHSMDWLLNPTIQSPALVNRAWVQENQNPDLNFWAGITQGIPGKPVSGRILEVSEKFLGYRSALNDLRESIDSAAGEGGVTPPQHTQDQAIAIIRGLCFRTSRIYSVYLMPDGAIAIDTRGRKPDGALLTVSTDGTICYSGEKDGQRWHRDYVGQDPLSDPNLLMELRELGLPKN